jgi:hypothetical protein
MLALTSKALRSKGFLVAPCALLAAVCLSAFQFGDRNGLNGLRYAQVQPLVSNLAKARSLAQQGNIDLLAGQAVPGTSITLRGELTDANCYLGSHTHAYDHAFCAKFCAAAGSPLVFVPDQEDRVYLVLTSLNGIPFPADILDQMGVPGIVVNGRVLGADGVRALMIESLKR